MNNIISLDCTLRDGGYCNDWNFGEQNIKKVISGLVASQTEIIECGFLTKKCKYNLNATRFTNIMQLNNFVPSNSSASMYVLMINYGEYDSEWIPYKRETVIDGIRVAFHKKDFREALKLCRAIKEKGYCVFMQPMVTMLYSDEEFTELLMEANDILPYAFYIVDSFGTMNQNNLLHYFDLGDKYLRKEIYMGFHSHNNMQSAFANAQCLIEKDTSRNIVVDSSVYGMGRGAGNLNAELFLNELNIKRRKKYEIKPLIQIMDSILNRFYEEKAWGYSLPNYLSAVHMIHPNYAGYLSEKKTLTVDDIDEIFAMIRANKGVEYDEKYIRDLYFQYMSAGIIRNEHLDEIKEKTKNRKILLVAPGKKAVSQKEKIHKFIVDNNPIVISINHEHPFLNTDYVFVSNIRRYQQLDDRVYSKTISTSNIKANNTYVSVDYFSLLNTVEPVRDNAGLMAIKFVVEELDVNQVYLVGMDGYSHDLNENYEAKEMSLFASEELMDAMNLGMKTVINEFKKSVNINFITSSLLDE